jgi:hypothetical protein
MHKSKFWLQPSYRLYNSRACRNANRPRRKLYQSTSRSRLFDVFPCAQTSRIYQAGIFVISFPEVAAEMQEATASLVEVKSSRLTKCFQERDVMTPSVSVTSVKRCRVQCMQLETYFARDVYDILLNRTNGIKCTSYKKPEDDAWPRAAR